MDKGYVLLRNVAMQSGRRKKLLVYLIHFFIRNREKKRSKKYGVKCEMCIRL
jgi:hypothetical protein